MDLLLGLFSSRTAFCRGNRTISTSAVSLSAVSCIPTWELQNDGSRYAYYSGTGNTLNANHPIVRRISWIAFAIGLKKCSWTGSDSI